MAQVQLGSGLGRIRVPKPRTCGRVLLRVVASVCFSLGLGVCLFYALYYQQGESTAVVMIRAWFVRTNTIYGRTYPGGHNG